MKNRVLVLANVLLLPYVWLRFPREAKRYTANCGRTLLDGKRR